MESGVKSSQSVVGVELLEQSIPERLQTQVLRYGDRPAIVFQGRSLTYYELNSWSNQIARAILAQRPVGAEPIALLFETGPAMIAAMLGVLKAGKFYVPLDISWPEGRLNLILEDSRAELILSDRYQLHAAKAAVGFELVVSSREVLWLDTLNSKISVENLEVQTYPDDLAYILYTSGSSGRPKGVVQNHRYVLNLWRNYSNSGAMTERDRISLLYSAAFGGAVRDIYCALLNGAALLPLDVKQIGLHQLGWWLQDHGITVTFMVATLFRHFAATLKGQAIDEPIHFPQLRLIQIGSETVYRQDAELFQQHFSDHCTLMVNLGGTEISPVRQFPITQHTVLVGSTVPAGYEVEGTEVVLWNDSGQVVAPGGVGEIVVRSRQVALGYWHQPELTEQVFIKEGDCRYFKTGDLGQLLPNGCLLHLGRKDFQIKIRGYRVESHEVEAALLNLGWFQAVVVAAQANTAGGVVNDHQLVAYLIPAKAQSRPTVRELKAALGAKLPSYMVPDCFMWLESLPLTPTGKVDRRALPQLKSISWTSELEIVPPRTAIEETLVKIWSEVLNFEPIGIQNNFFELGGNSLRASQVLARISQQFNIELPLKLIFEAPTISQLSDHLNSVKVSTSLPGLALTPTKREPEVPLSPAQQGLWFLDQLEPGSSAYTMPAAYYLTGQLDITALEQSLAEIIRRHEILRTTFPGVDGQPRQVISQHKGFTLPIIDLQKLPSDQRQAEAQRQVNEAARHPFNLTQGPLFRVELLRLSDAEHVLVLTLHHIVSDGWSMGVLFQELGALYHAFSTGRSFPLPELAIQYADVACWQRQWLTGEMLGTQLAYWRKQLDGASPVLELPTDHPRVPVQTFRGRVEQFQLNPDLTQQLKRFSQESGVTLFMTLLAAFYILLYRYSGQEDIMIGSPIAGRKQAEVEKLIGFFVNTLTLRADLSGNPTFQTFLDRVKQVALDAYTHQDVPFEKLVEELQPARDLSRSPWFQVMFVLQNFPTRNLELLELSTTPLSVEIDTAKFELTLSMWEAESGLKGTWSYNTDLFDTGTIIRMAGHFQTLLEAVVASPQQRISTLPLLTAAQQHQLLVEWNNTQTNYPTYPCIHQLFEAQVERTPNAIAAVFENQYFTYEQLNRRANQLAHHLQTVGVGPEVPVGICVERSLEMLIGLLGILKSGGAYVPLDPTYPQERLAFILQDTEASVLLTQEPLVKKLPEHRAKVVYLDTDRDAINQENQENPKSGVTPDNLAYVMYTSGSTGRPKGVSIVHQGVVRLVKEANYAHLTAEEVFLQLAPISFDASTFEIWGSLLNGARLVIFPSHTPSLEELGQAIVQYQITTLWLTAGLFHLMVDERLEDLKPLSQLLTGGDVLSVPHVQRFLQEIKDCKLINGYGPTENTTFTCCYPVTAPEQIGNSVPIGRPITNTQVYILDRNLQPVPIGVPGELHIGGVGLARGYLNRPELTTEKFIPNPWSEEPGARLYKTGDLARYLPDGNIEFLSRLDHQVKIRGFRIELGEVESVLVQHPAVQQTVVTAREDIPGDKRLVAYVVTNQDQVTITTLRQFLQQTLPNYMVPSAFVVLDTLPLTPNGKVDRRTLPAANQTIPESEKPFVTAQDPLELELTKIWENILGIQPIGVKDNFFELGGHSLLAVRLFAQIEKQFGKSLPLSTLFQAPTVEKLASHLRQSSGSAPWKSLVMIQPGSGSKLPFFWTHTTGGGVLHYRSLAHHLGLDQPFYGLQAQGLNGNQAPYTRIEDMAAYYIKEIQTLQPKGPYFLGGFCFGGIIAFEMAQQLQAQGQQVALLALIETYRLDESKLLPIKYKIKLHLYEFIDSKPKEKLTYVVKQVKSKIRWLKNRIKKRFWIKIVHTYYERIGHPLPQKVQTQVLEEISKNALRNYVPQDYPGRITLFLGREVSVKKWSHDPRLSWAKLAAGGLEICEIPGKHNTTGANSMIQEPHVLVLAKKLRAYIDMAQE